MLKCPVVLLLALCCHIEPVVLVEFTAHPQDTMATINTNVTFNCTVAESGSNLAWSIITPGRRLLDTTNHNDRDMLIARGIFSEQMGNMLTLTILASVENNSTYIACRQLGINTEFSNNVTLTVIGPPLPPSPSLSVLNTTSLILMWEEPYSAAAYPVNAYNIRITSGQEVFVQNQQQNASETTFNFIRPEGFSDCRLVMLSVSALSGVGESRTGSVSGGFPITPGPINTSQVDTDVRFSNSGQPELDVVFMFMPQSSLLCSYQSATYSIVIEPLRNTTSTSSANAGTILSHPSSFNGTQLLIMESFHTGLTINTIYLLTLTVASEGVANTSVTVEFSTDFMFPPSTEMRGTEVTKAPSSPLGLFEIVGIAIGSLVGCLLCLLLCVIATGVSCREKKHKVPISGINARLNNQQLNSMGYPKAEESPYETIDDYQSRRTAPNNHPTCSSFVVAPNDQDPCHKRYQQRQLPRFMKEDSPYQAMNPADGWSPENDNMLQPQYTDSCIELTASMSSPIPSNMPNNDHVRVTAGGNILYYPRSSSSGGHSYEQQHQGREENLDQHLRVVQAEIEDGVYTPMDSAGTISQQEDMVRSIGSYPADVCTGQCNDCNCHMQDCHVQDCHVQGDFRFSTC